MSEWIRKESMAGSYFLPRPLNRVVILLVTWEEMLGDDRDKSALGEERKELRGTILEKGDDT